MQVAIGLPVLFNCCGIAFSETLYWRDALINSSNNTGKVIIYAIIAGISLC